MTDTPRRRDPRAERARRAQGGRQPATEEPGAPEGRQRRNPRSDRNRRGRRSGAPDPVRRAEEGPLAVEAPAGWVLAVPDLAEGRLNAHDRDVIGGARTLADAHGGGVAAVAFGAPGAGLGAAGADRILHIPGPEDAYDPEARAAALLTAMEELTPWHVVLADTIPGAGDLGRRVAAERGEGLAADVRRLEADRLICRGDGDRREYHLRPPRFVLLAPEGAEPYSGPPREGRVLPRPAAAPGTALVDEGPIPVDARSLPLEEADFILSAGNGVSDWDTFHRLSAALGAAEGGTRVVCDAGLLPRERQVGISGALVGAHCYLALGISGAPQHLQGIEDCARVVAVNTDPYAPIMKRADLAVAGDVQAVMEALLHLMEEEGHAP
ncbi:electron transfer flavoprotein subunit alpha/FixB family protein [Thiohalorhabdus sp. Cl-TMA]|uniref:Electron transfer flavoprotein subunit alpha/FixB family protein n=1 Tax=Thiohalorhabdus methylotrophus TaxID=3242694 RepID=A0ABV4TVK1_9GAMM